MLLWLVRHGIAEDLPPAPSHSDADRALTEIGRKRMERAARGLARLRVRPDVVYSSPLLRARQTAEIVVRPLGLAAETIRVTDALQPDSDPNELLALLLEVRASSVLCVGHCPHVERMTSALLAGHPRGDGSGNRWIEFKKGAAACLRLEARTGGPARLVWFASPGDLRALA